MSGGVDETENTGQAWLLRKLGLPSAGYSHFRPIGLVLRVSIQVRLSFDVATIASKSCCSLNTLSLILGRIL